MAPLVVGLAAATAVDVVPFSAVSFPFAVLPFLPPLGLLFPPPLGFWKAAGFEVGAGFGSTATVVEDPNTSPIIAADAVGFIVGSGVGFWVGNFVGFVKQSIVQMAVSVQ